MPRGARGGSVEEWGQREGGKEAIGKRGVLGKGGSFVRDERIPRSKEGRDLRVLEKSRASLRWRD